MSDVLTRTQDFRAVPPSAPSMQAIRPQQGSSFALAALTLGIGLAALTPLPIVFPSSRLIVSNVAPEVGQKGSPAVFTKRATTTTRAEEFSKALSDAIELSATMVAEDEAAALDTQTWVYAVCSLLPIYLETAPPLPLMLPLQNGGFGAEWHEAGMNIELRFRSPYRVYAVVEDARGVIPPFHGGDPHLVQARTALHELASRAAG